MRLVALHRRIPGFFELESAYVMRRRAPLGDREAKRSMHVVHEPYTGPPDYRSKPIRR